MEWHKFGLSWCGGSPSSRQNSIDGILAAQFDTNPIHLKPDKRIRPQPFESTMQSCLRPSPPPFSPLCLLSIALNFQPIAPSLLDYFLSLQVSSLLLDTLFTPLVHCSASCGILCSNIMINILTYCFCTHNPCFQFHFLSFTYVHIISGQFVKVSSPYEYLTPPFSHMPSYN